jgi:hypothetical protein
MALIYEIVAKNIVHFPEALLSSSEIVDFLENKTSSSFGNWVPWISQGDSEPYQYGLLKELTPKKLSEELDPTIKYQAEKLISDIYDTFDACYEEYYRIIKIPSNEIKVHIDSYRKNRPSHIAIKKYFNYEYLGPHPDSNSSDPIEFTASMYFNDNYVGGHLHFPEQGATVVPKPGSVVVFPASYLHESTRLSSGTKYVTNLLNSLPKSTANGII